MKLLMMQVSVLIFVIIIVKLYYNGVQLQKQLLTS
jgi:hypothetical protein